MGSIKERKDNGLFPKIWTILNEKNFMNKDI